jgi:hypothetical protein
MRRLGAIVVAALVLLGGCASDAPRTIIGVRKVSLSLAFKDENLTPPVPTRVVVNIIPALPEAIQQALPGAVTYPPLPSGPPVTFPPPPTLCPKAPPGSSPSEPATVAITRPPAPGIYYKRNDGRIGVTGGVIPISVPYPPFTRLVIGNVKSEDRSDVYQGTVRVTTFESTEELTPTISVKSYFLYDRDSLDLVREEVINSGQITSFQPTPAVQMLAFTGPGTTWNHAGIDVGNGTAQTVQGSIDAQREIIDVCGQLVDTLKVSTGERRVELATGNQNGSDPDKPILQSYALQLGGLVVRREEHSSRVVQAGDAKLVLHTDVVSTLLSIEPGKKLL